MSDDRSQSEIDADDAQALSAQAADESAGVAQQIEEIPAPDGADVLEGLSTSEAADVAEYLDPQTAGRILSEMQPALAASVLQDMEPAEASMVVSAMNPDDAVDILGLISQESHDAIVKELAPEAAAEVRRLEQYAPDTAGGIMTPDVTALAEDLSVEQAVVELRRLSEQTEQMFYVYVVDRRKHLIGVLSMRDLILSRPDKRLNQIMRTNVARVPATMDQEEVARLMRRHNYLALPVVDNQNRLLGLITLDDAVDVMEEEATEDVQKMFGAGAEERLASPWNFSFKKRVWWLEVNLLTAFMAAWVVSRFDNVIQTIPIIAAWQTVVSGMGGNAGAQAMAVAIRGIALGEANKGILWKVFLRESIVGLTTGVVIGLTAALFASAGIFGYHDHPYVLGGVVAAALLINHLMACTSGAAIPFIMKGLGFDPAQSATIFATTVTDCCGFFTTLGIAQLCMPWLKSLGT